MMTLQELHEHYRSVKGRLNDPAKAFVPKKVPTATMVVPDSETIIKLFEPKFSSPSSEIIYRVAQKHGVSVADIKGQSRRPMFVKARQEAAYEIREQRGLSLPQISKMLGDRDHTSILHGIKRHTAFLAKQAEAAE
tara:strand:+ start:252 stop:659 length:408 start_codon:yes stop_codon:yes gene_type:complete